MQWDFSGKVAVVTGGSRGIGQAIAEALLAFGAEVLITSTQAGKPEWASRFPRSRHAQLNFLDDSGAKSFFQTLEQLSRIDILLNNAGIQIRNPIDTTRDEDWQQLLTVNLTGPMQLMRAVAPRMRQQKSGWILNMSSIAGFIARPGGGAYSATKTGLIGLTRAAALDLAPDGVLVNALCPGVTQTDMIDQVLSAERKEEFRRESALGRFALPEEIANVALFLVSDLNTYITGQAIVADGGTIIQ